MRTVMRMGRLGRSPRGDGSLCLLLGENYLLQPQEVKRVFLYVMSP